jgi:uncharacterized protein YrrD
MHFKEHADVLASNGEKIGRIHRVVVDPGTGAVTHLVVKKGLLLAKDKVVPVDQVETADEDHVLLKKGMDNPDEFPDFEETHHVPIGGIEDFQEREAEHARRMIWYHTETGIPWWGPGSYPGLPKPLFVKKTERNVPRGEVALEEGAKVIDAQGEPVGDVEDIYAEPVEHRVTHILVSSGTFSKEKKLIPTAWVKDIFEDSVRLSAEKKIIENLPDAASPPEGA